MLFNTFSMQTIYHRFFAYIKMPPARIARFTNMDYVKQMAIVGEELKDGQYRLVGVARYAQFKEDPHKGELAIVIGDPWQGQGIGTVMMQYLVDIAHIGGYEELIALVHYDNEAIPRVFNKLTCMIKKRDNGTEWLFKIYPGRPKETA
jgi:acetyltransferase